MRKYLVINQSLVIVMPVKTNIILCSNVPLSNINSIKIWFSQNIIIQFLLNREKKQLDQSKDISLSHLRIIKKLDQVLEILEFYWAS